MGDIDRIEEVISEHAVSIALMTRAVSSIEGLLTQQTLSIKEIEKAMKSQELLMEKFTHLDARLSDSVNRIHKRIDGNEADILAIKKEHKDACDIVKPMATKGATAHSWIVTSLIGVAIALAGVVGTIIVWAIEQGATK